MVLRLAAFFSVVVVLSFISTNTLKAQCSDEVVWAEPEELLDLGIDSTGHWWVLSAPFQDFKTITIDGIKYGPFNDIHSLTFHRSGETWAFIARSILKSLIVTPDGIREFIPRIDSVFFPTESEELWWIESVGIDRKLTNGSKEFAITFPVKAVALHSQAYVVSWVEQRPGVEVLMRNGEEVARGDDVQLAGIWLDGTCVYAVGLSGRWSIWSGDTEHSSNLANVKSLSTNYLGTVMAWAEYYLSTGPRVKMFSSDMIRAWESPTLENIQGPVVLSPQDELLAFKARRVGRSLVYFNGAEYPAGERAGTPFFSNDGSVMAYATENAGNYIAINGKLFLLKSGAPVNIDVAVSPSGEQASWSTSSTILLEDLEFNVLRTGRMCDKTTRAVYSGRDETFKALGVITNRVYLMSCTAR